jgi:WW domain
LSQCPWKEYKTEVGKTYYHNVSTKETRWNIPPELEELKKKIQTEEKPRYNWSLDELYTVFITLILKIQPANNHWPCPSSAFSQA